MARDVQGGASGSGGKVKGVGSLRVLAGLEVGRERRLNGSLGPSQASEAQNKNTEKERERQ